MTTSQPLTTEILTEQLTRREHEVASLVALACNNDEIAQKLNISPYTVHVHIQRIKQKQNLKNRVAICLWVLKIMSIPHK